VCLDAAVRNKPEVMVGGVAQLFNDNGQLTDTPTREHVTKLLSALAERVQAENR
jgi:chromate reductase